MLSGTNACSAERFTGQRLGVREIKSFAVGSVLANLRRENLFLKSIVNHYQNVKKVGRLSILLKTKRLFIEKYPTRCAADPSCGIVEKITQIMLMEVRRLGLGKKTWVGWSIKNGEELCSIEMDINAFFAALVAKFRQTTLNLMLCFQNSGLLCQMVEPFVRNVIGKRQTMEGEG